MTVYEFSQSLIYLNTILHNIWLLCPSGSEARGIAPMAGGISLRGRRDGGEIDDPAAGNSEVRKFEEQVRELERLLGRKTLQISFLNGSSLELQPACPVEIGGQL